MSSTREWWSAGWPPSCWPSSSYRGTGGPPYSSSSMFFTQSLIQGDRWTSILKLKQVTYSIPHTRVQVNLHTQAQVSSVVSPSYRGTSGPPYSSSCMFFTVRLGPRQNRVTWKTPSRAAFEPLSKASSGTRLLHSPHTNVGMKQYKCGHNHG